MQNETVETTIELLVPPALAFNAWLNKEMLSKWMFAEPGSEVVDTALSPEVGDRFSIVQQTMGNHTRVEFTGKYLHIHPHHELEFELNAPKYTGSVLQVKASFEPTAKGCRITVSQKGPAGGLTTQHWNKMLEQLRMSLELQ